MIDFMEKPMTAQVRTKALNVVRQVLLYGTKDEERDRCLSVTLDEGIGTLEVAFFEKDSEGKFKTAYLPHINLREDNFGRTSHKIIQEINELLDVMKKFHNGEDWKKEYPNE